MRDPGRGWGVAIFMVAMESVFQVLPAGARRAKGCQPLPLVRLVVAFDGREVCYAITRELQTGPFGFWQASRFC
jgi:hypothetical protein